MRHKVKARMMRAIIIFLYQIVLLFAKIRNPLWLLSQKCDGNPSNTHKCVNYKICQERIISEYRMATRFAQSNKFGCNCGLATEYIVNCLTLFLWHWSWLQEINQYRKFKKLLQLKINSYKYAFLITNISLKSIFVIYPKIYISFI